MAWTARRKWGNVMKSKLKIVRRIPIDFMDIFRQSGMRRGTICKTIFGWAVQNTQGVNGPHVALIEPPALQGTETELRIVDNHWCFYGPAGKGNKKEAGE